jgi:hypothetical protein
VELGLARVRPELAETAREHRAPRGVTADRVGKALKAEIPWADVARNKATRPGRAQTAERVRNSESGWCRRGKPVQRSPGFIRRREPNSKGDVVVFPLRVLRSRVASAARGWEASFGRMVAFLLISVSRTASVNPKEPLRAPTVSAVCFQQGSFVAATSASAVVDASRKHPVSRFGSSPGEARCDDACARRHSVTACRVNLRFRPR